MNRDTFSSEFLGANERGSQHDSFSDEFRGAPEAQKHDSFSNEFRGVSEPAFRDERPSGVYRRRGGGKLGWILAIIAVALVLFGGGAWAVWYWSEPIGAWLASLGETEALAPPEASTEAEPAVEPAPEVPAEPPVEKVFGIKGAPEGADAEPLPTGAEGLPVEPLAGPQPTTPPTAARTIETLTTQVRGKVSSGGVGSRLAGVDAALRECWARSAAGSVELELRFGIKWNGKAHSISVTGGDEALQRCVKQALPSGGWPHPSDGGDASVTRRWKLSG